MPLYEYHCDHCGQNFEKMQQFSERNQRPKCPTCSSTETHRRISVFARSAGSLSLGGSSSSDTCGSSGGFS